MKVWEQIVVFLVVWLGIDAILSSFIGWIAGLIGVVCAVFIVMRLRKKYPNVEKQIRKRENKQSEDDFREAKRQYIAERGKEEWRKKVMPEIKRKVKEEVKWHKQDVKIQAKDFKDSEKKRRKALYENCKAQVRDERKYLTYAQKLKLNSMIYTNAPQEIQKIKEEWIRENKQKGEGRE